MDEVQENSAIPEVAPQATEIQEAQPVVQEAPKVIQEDDRQERNWKAARERQKDLERELKMKNELLERFLTSPAAQPPKEVDEFDAIGDDEFIPKGKVSKLIEKKAMKIAGEIAQQETQKILKARDQDQFLDKLKRKYSDFDEVVNADTMALLEQQDPELAETIVDLKDPYKIGMQTYKYVKAMNLNAKVPDSRRAKEVEKKLEQNAKTIQSPQAYDKRPMAQAFKMTDAEKTQLYSEMMGYASQV